MHRYEIGGKTYVQKPLVLGQIRQLTELMNGCVLPGDFNAGAIMYLLGERLPRALAIVLCEEGKPLKEKDVEALTSELEFNAGPEDAVRIIEDFFACNPVVSLLEKVTGTVNAIKENLGKTPSSGPSASSQKETSRKGTKSSGDTR